MVRTKADASSVRAAGAKAPRKIQVLNPAPKKSNPNSGVGGNPYCPRETPDWQKSITYFFTKASEDHLGSRDSSGSGVTNNHGSKVDAEDCGSEVVKNMCPKVAEDNGSGVAENHLGESSQSTQAEK